jgi:hypothetical protein
LATIRFHACAAGVRTATLIDSIQISFVDLHACIQLLTCRSSGCLCSGILKVCIQMIENHIDKGHARPERWNIANAF